MLSRIRHNLKSNENAEFGDMTQTDETLIGGKTRKRRKWDKPKEENEKGSQGRSRKKTVVMGLLYNGQVYAQVVPDAEGTTLKPIIYGLVKKGSIIITDGWTGYKGLKNDYTHKVIPHNKGIYAIGKFSTNGIEGAWSILKKMIYGIYHVVSKKHLPQYLLEFMFKYNTRDNADGERVVKFLASDTERLKYRVLIA